MLRRLSSLSTRRVYSEDLASTASNEREPDVPTSLRESTVGEDDVDPLVVFEPVSGVTTRELRPSADSTFTCHVFSRDGTVLATGESDGTLRVWNTADFRCKACWPSLFRHPISAMNFMKGVSNRLIVVDREGNLSDFEISPDGQSHNQRRRTIHPLRNQRSLKDPECRAKYPEALTHQFSEAGDVLACVYCRRSNYRSSKFPEVSIYNFGKNPVKRINMTFECSSTCVPILSKNGRSLLTLFPSDKTTKSQARAAPSRHRSGVWVVPELNFACREQREIHLRGDRAFWGMGGHYLLVWDTKNSIPRLSVYETKSLSYCQSRTPTPLCQRTLRAQLSYWKATMLRPRSQESHLEILIYEMAGERRVFSVWDIDQDDITREVRMMFSPSDSGFHMHFALSKSASLRSRSRRPPTEEEIFIFSALDDVFSDFCATSDGNWIGAVSWNDQAVGLSSFKWGVTSWSTIFADELLDPPLVMANEVKFDASEHHLLIFGEEVIQAFAPSFLNEDFVVGRHIKELHQNLTSLSNASDRHCLIDAYQCLPSKALGTAWEIGASTHRVRLAWFRSRREVYKGATVIDSALSSDKKRLALLVKGLRGSFAVSMRDACSTEVDDDDCYSSLKLPMQLEDKTEFIPERIFLYEDQEGAEGVALLSCGPDPKAVFCGIGDETILCVRLGMSSCLKICRWKDSMDVLLLDEDAVCILNLQKGRLIDRRPFQSNIRSLISKTSGSLNWRWEQSDNTKNPHSENSISQEGDAVLLAWDTKNQRSIVVTPAMKQKECEDLILASDGSLSEFCTLSASGEYTVFFDVDELKQGRVTIAMFSERGKRITFRVDADQEVPTNLTYQDMQKVLANVFYGLSSEETELMVYTVGESSASSVQLLKDRFSRFQVHPGVRCVPNYDLLRLVTGNTDETLVDRLSELHGVSLFNMPFPIGLTMFQNAVSQKKKAMTKRLKHLARKQGTELALEWETPRTESEDIVVPKQDSTSGSLVPSRTNSMLKLNIDTHCTNDIKEAIGTVCSRVAPFTSAAKIMKDSFVTLLLKYGEVLEEGLSDNWLVQEACQIDVHVDFLDYKLGVEKAVHIATTDSYLRWSEPADKEALEEMWRAENLEVINKMECDGNTSTKKASLMFVRVEDAAKAGMKGIIRPLLLGKVPLYFFEFDIVKWIVMYKWLKIWKHMFLWQGLEYLCFLIVFTAYAGLLAVSGNLRDRDLNHKIMLAFVLGATAIFGARMALEELRQMCTYMQEGKEYFKSKWMGLRYFLGFKWNWVDMLSCLLTVILIPLFHILTLCGFGYDEHLSISVAIEAIAAYAKVWYFAQPFRDFGSLVRMVSDVAKDCFAFIALGFAVLLGFGVAFHVLFRHVLSEDIDGSGEEAESDYDSPDNDGPSFFMNRVLLTRNRGHGGGGGASAKGLGASDDGLESAREAFGTLPKSLLTMFYALLGEFESDIYLSAGHMTWLTVTTFITYMLTQTIIMLNFLISIMGDTFDRVKDDEESQLSIGRADFIDACEASLSRDERKRINDMIGKYLIVLVEAKDHTVEEIDTSKQWMGKLNKIESSCRKVVQKSERNVKGLIEEQKREVARVNRVVEDLADETRRMSERLEQLESKVENGQRIMTERMDQLLAALRRD